MNRLRNRKGFTLLEVTISLAILALSLSVLVDYQGTSFIMTRDATDVRMATMLAEEKMAEAQLRLEEEGWTTRDVEESGDFGDFGEEDFRSENLQVEMKEQLQDFQWAYTIRQIELSIPTDMNSMAGDLMDGGYFGEKDTEDLQNNTFDLGDIGITPDMISDQLSSYIREVRVLIWWGENEDKMDQVELLTHVINPTGMVTDPEGEEQ